MSQDKNKQQPSHAFLENREAINQMKENLPYIIECWYLDAESMHARYEALKAKGFTATEALEIIKARGTQM